MQQIPFTQIRQDYFEKNCRTLNGMANYITPMYKFNSALLDKDVSKIKSLKKQFELQDIKYQIINISDNIKNKSRLRIVYLIGNTELDSNTKIIFEQSNKLAERGHEVLLYSHCPKPGWVEGYSNFFLVHHECSLSSVIPSCDIVIACHWDLVLDALRVNAPLRYFYAQGDNDLLEYDISSNELKTAIQTAYTLPLRIITVSDVMKQTIHNKFKRKAVKVPIALSPEYLSAQADFKKENEPLIILLEGMDSLKYYETEIILDALEYLKNLGYRFVVNLLSKHKEPGDYSKYTFDIKEHSGQTGEALADLFRMSDIYVCNSYYEPFTISVLEAMACGTAVITSDNSGIQEFAVDGYNCLVHEPGNIIKLIYNLQQIMNNLDLRIKIKTNGLITARRFTWKRSADKLEKEFNQAAACTFQAISN